MSSTASAVAKDENDELLEAVDDAVADAQEDGTYDKIYKKYFGDAPTMTAASTATSRR